MAIIKNYNSRKMKKHMIMVNNTMRIIPLFILNILFFIGSSANADFVKYKNYLIPVGSIDCENKTIPVDADIPLDTGKARVFITTDIAGGDQDDGQSLAHILAFSDKVEIEGFATSDPNQSNSIETGITAIKNMIEAYGRDLDQLRQRGGSFPSASALLSEVYKGSTIVGNQNGGGWSSSAASEAIVKKIRCAYSEGERRPLNILTWGTSSEAIRAIEAAPDIVKYIRIVSYSAHNNHENRHGDYEPVFQYLSRISKRKNLGGMALKWIDYNGSKKPLQRCQDSVTNGLQNSGDMGSLIDMNRDLECEGLYGQSGFKLGDTITTLFSFNSAASRNNPGQAYWGNYFRPDASSRPNLWRLRVESHNRRSQVYSDWFSRVSGLR